MGTTLTGTTPQDTYDSLIKVTDNGPIGATPKYLSDGLGTDSSLALSTKNILIGTTTAVVNYGRELVVDATALTSEPEAFLALKGNRVSGNIAAVPFYNGAEQVGSITMQAEGNMRLLTGTTTANTSEKVRITAAGNVGIGTTTPASLLSIEGSSAAVVKGIILRNGDGTDGSSIALDFEASLGTIGDEGALVGRILGLRTASGTTGALTFSTTNGGTLTEKVRILPTGGITFNGDTAAANALDDYEEGTWTMGVSFGGASAGVTADNFTGTYTKIGRQVTVNGYFVLTSKGSSTGSAKITGLPFTIADGGPFYSVPSLWLDDITFANVYSGYGVVGDTKIDLYEFTEAGVNSTLTNADFADTSRIMLSFTYFV